MAIFNPKFDPKKFNKMFGPNRMNGIFLHPTSLPSKFGIGDLGKNARKFIDLLACYNQKIWQILPLGPTGYGNSPYQCFSAFAGNPLLISPTELVERKLLSERDIMVNENFSDSKINYEIVKEFKENLLRKAFSNFKTSEDSFKKEFENFQIEQKYWLNDYSLFMALKELHNEDPWYKWEKKFKLREKDKIEQFEKKNSEKIEFYKFIQFIFSHQWNTLKRYANKRSIKIFGDIPIFVAYDSSDVWANPEFFSLDENGGLKFVAGVPPDEFSETGQRWGNPLYRWIKLEEQGFKWWIERIKHSFKLVDILRIDHFRGFESYWRIPADEPTAVIGKWCKGPGNKFFKTLKKNLGTLPIIAEDLGVITNEVEKLLEKTGYPGMRVLQFAFGSKMNEERESKYLPHFYVPNTVVYTGTHDNNTTLGWYNSLSSKIKDRVKSYITDTNDIIFSLIRLAISSVSRICIIPFQDILKLGKEARLNFPGTTKGNWIWRFTWDQINKKDIEKISEMCEIYERD